MGQLIKYNVTYYAGLKNEIISLKNDPIIRAKIIEENIPDEGQFARLVYSGVETEVMDYVVATYPLLECLAVDIQNSGVYYVYKSISGKNYYKTKSGTFTKPAEISLPKWAEGFYKKHISKKFSVSVSNSKEVLYRSFISESIYTQLFKYLKTEEVTNFGFARILFGDCLLQKKALYIASFLTLFSRLGEMEEITLYMDVENYDVSKHLNAFAGLSQDNLLFGSATLKNYFVFNLSSNNCREFTDYYIKSGVTSKKGNIVYKNKEYSFERGCFEIPGRRKPSILFEANVEYDKGVLTKVFETETNFTVPSGITAIADGAFGYSKKISRITLPSSIKRLHKEALMYADVKSVEFSEGCVFDESFIEALANAKIKYIKFPNKPTIGIYEDFMYDLIYEKDGSIDFDYKRLVKNLNNVSHTSSMVGISTDLLSFHREELEQSDVDRLADFLIRFSIGKKNVAGISNVINICKGARLDFENLINLCRKQDNTDLLLKILDMRSDSLNYKQKRVVRTETAAIKSDQIMYVGVRFEDFTHYDYWCEYIVFPGDKVKVDGRKSDEWGYVESIYPKHLIESGKKQVYLRRVVEAFNVDIKEIDVFEEL